MTADRPTPPGDDAHLLRQQLEQHLPEVLPGASLHDLRRLSGGASRETWLLGVTTPAGDGQQLILRRDPVSEPRPAQMGHESVALAAARRHGVPEPQLVDSGTDFDTLGAPYLLMTFVPGETIARRILRDDRYAGARAVLAADLGRAAARIHQIPLDEVADLPRQDTLAELRRRYEETGVLRPVVELAFRWLEEHRPDTDARTTMVHGDFRLGNVIVDEQGLAAILDWELVHLGDPLEDLGYLSIRAWRFGGPHPVAGVGGFAELFDAYEEVSGRRPDSDTVFWWQVVGTLNWAVGCLVQADRHFSGATRSVELAAIGRRVAEQEYDLLRMLSRTHVPARSH